MLDLRTLARPLLATPFIVGGLNTLRAPKATADVVAGVAVPIAEVVGLPTDAEKLVTLNAAVQIGGGVLLALGVAPRLMAAVLAASLVPTTIAGHRFWEKKVPAERTAQLVQFAKNAGIVGGLVVAALDQGGRPSVFWAGRRALSRTGQAVSGSVQDAFRALPGTS